MSVMMTQIGMPGFQKEICLVFSVILSSHHWSMVDVDKCYFLDY